MTLRVKGFDGIDRALRRLDNTMRADTLVRVLTESAEPIEQDYRSGAPPVIARSVRTRVISKAPHRGTVATGTKHPLAHIFEFGTRLRRTAKGFRRGRIVKIGFGRRAFDTGVNRWFRDTGRLLWREVKRARR